jgi:cytoskeletal protein RodZ
LTTVGEILRSTREAKGLSLAEAEQGTKIRQKYIAALEDDNVSALPGPIYARGFIRNYASFLELDVNDILAQYDEQRVPTRDKMRVARGEPAPKASTRPDAEKISIQPLSNERIDTRVRYGSQYIALSLLAIPLLIIFYFVYNAAAGPKNEGVPIPTITIHPPTVTSVALSTVLAGGPGTGDFNTPTVFVPPTPNLVAALPVTPTVALTPTLPASAAKGIILKIVTSNDAWMSVLVDGVQQYTGTVAKGGTKQWKGNKNIQVRTGRADSVHIYVNGSDKGLMGSPDNLIVEKRWDSGGNETVVQP